MSGLLERAKVSKYPESVWLGKANGKEIIDLIEQQQAKIAELEKRNEHLEHIQSSHNQVLNAFDAMITERDELAVTVERLREYGSILEALSGGNLAVNAAKAEWRKSLESALHQNLNSLKREVAIDAYKSAIIGWEGYENLLKPQLKQIDNLSKQYAEQKYPIGKEGE